MSKFDGFIKKCEEHSDYKGKDKFDKFIFKYGKWFLVIVCPLLLKDILYGMIDKNMYVIISLFLLTYLFCLFFCFIDIYNLYLKFKNKNSAK